LLVARNFLLQIQDNPDITHIAKVYLKMLMESDK